ncbi:MAG: ABC transporter ATP-binding protein [Gammaproteobacteria bacterium]
MIHSSDLACQLPGGRMLQFPDVDLPAGGTLLLRGPSGSGKSTWLALVAGLRSGNRGRLSVAGAEVGAMAPAARDAWRARTIGFLPQRLLLSEALNVTDNLALVYVATGRPVDRTRIAQTLDALGVAAMATRRPSQLSGGEAQRVALARALLLRPPLILADEPTASLDDTACEQALALLQARARDAGAALVVATHDARVLHALPNAQRLDLPGAVA